MSPGTILDYKNGYSFYFLLTYRVEGLEHDILLCYRTDRHSMTIVGSFANDDSFYEVYYT